MNCQEFVRFLMEYLERTLDEQQREMFEQHIADCPPCGDYLRSYERSVALGRTVCNCVEEDVPEEVPDQLVQAILAARRAGG